MFSAPRFGSVEPRGIQHVPVIEGKHEIGARAPPLGDPLDGIGIVRRLDPQAVRLARDP